jgi:hypothetical protein
MERTSEERRRTKFFLSYLAQFDDYGEDVVTNNYNKEETVVRTDTQQQPQQQKSYDAAAVTDTEFSLTTITTPENYNPRFASIPGLLDLFDVDSYETMEVVWTPDPFCCMDLCPEEDVEEEDQESWEDRVRGAYSKIVDDEPPVEDEADITAASFDMNHYEAWKVCGIERRDRLYYLHPFTGQYIPRFTNELNVHPRDMRVKFFGGIDEPDLHHYEIDGSHWGVISVTTLIHLLFSPFDSAAVAEKCSRFTKDVTSPYFKRSVDEIEFFWEVIRDTGTVKHASIDEYLQGKPSRTIQRGASLAISGPPQGFFEFLKAHPDWIVVRTEWSLFLGHLLFAGQMDAVFWDTRRKIFIGVDWKNNVNFKKTNSYNEWGCHPFTHNDPDCHFSHYTIQLNLYREMLKRAYGIILSEMWVVIFPALADTTFIEEKIPERDVSPVLDILPTPEGRRRLKEKPVPM